MDGGADDGFSDVGGSGDLVGSVLGVTDENNMPDETTDGEARDSDARDSDARDSDARDSDARD